MPTNLCPANGGHFWDDALPGVWCNFHREQRDHLKAYDAERRAERAAAEQARSVESRMAEFLDEQGKFDPYHQKSRAVVAERISRAQTRYPTPSGKHAVTRSEVRDEVLRPMLSIHGLALSDRERIEQLIANVDKAAHLEPILIEAKRLLAKYRNQERNN